MLDDGTHWLGYVLGTGLVLCLFYLAWKEFKE